MFEIKKEIINEKNRDRCDYIVLNNGKEMEDWRNSTIKDPGDWIEHEDEMTGASYWYSPSTKITRNTEPPPPRKLLKKRKSSMNVLSKKNKKNTEVEEELTKEKKLSLLPGIKTKKDVVHHGFQYWGERIHLSEPLGAHIQMNVAPFVVSFCIFFICFFGYCSYKYFYIVKSYRYLLYSWISSFFHFFFFFFFL